MADTSETAPRPEFDRFRDLASRLAKVPKKELDDAREREAAKRS